MPRKSTEAAMDAARPSAAKPAGVTDDPQYLASMHLVDQAQRALSQGDPDNAIAPLEQAIQVDVYNGEAFFGLARAWKMKGSHSKALEFANKAEILFQDNPRKLREVYLLKAELFKELQDGSKAEYYLNKAARLN
ncbi:tetratricopeptide repeat protein [Desulfoferrobacter suflitae]|uniref:tetratricopeptide repeat protein n=1 Tax=Desulfoferrobacter suflitae TaxID=2865782 RepID=UPI0021644679|nr:tetratricopeptide repeat protein [Desulfoferrobacter suflitae]MCK8602123.1 tetratricopeptide repeat protein [Desulfoferrobacter suflitae]